MNKHNKTYRQQRKTGGYQRGRELGVGKMGDRVNCMVMDRNQICDHFVAYTYIE